MAVLIRNGRLRRTRRFTLIRGAICLALSAGVLLAFAFAGLSATNVDAAAPKGLPDVEHPKDNPPTPAKLALGKQLFFDKRLSSDNTISCASCHDPKKGWSNGTAFATGVDGKVGGRSAPTIINAAYSRFQFWDGREPSLEAQALGPIQNSIEMNMPLKVLVAKLQKIKGYRKQFQAVFAGDVTSKNIAKAIAAYERTILSGDAPYDRFKAGDKSAMSAAAQRGLILFTGKAHCSACHSGPNFSDKGFHNVGISIKKKNPDLGRVVVSQSPEDRGSFKTPTLREISRTAPYMHDGSLKTLKDVVAHYNGGGTANDQLDEEVFALKLTKKEQADLITFLKEGLSSKSYPLHKPPKLPK
ncbi:MAG: c-type cytochrome [Planctomycetes bacterium]|nr:c-type cytochrome [Planctomycetota bacterium]